MFDEQTRSHTSPPRRLSPSGGWSLDPRCVLSSCWPTGPPSYTLRCGPTSWSRRWASLKPQSGDFKPNPQLTRPQMQGNSEPAAPSGWKYQPLTSYCSQSGDDTWAGGWCGALAALSLSLVYTGRSLDCDLMLKAFMRERKIKFIKWLLMLGA